MGEKLTGTAGDDMEAGRIIPTALPCPKCSTGEMSVIEFEPVGVFCVECECGYSGPTAWSADDAIHAHNHAIGETDVAVHGNEADRA